MATSVNISSTDAALQWTRELLKRYGLNPDELSHVLLQNLARQPTVVQVQAAEAYAESIKSRQQAAIDAKLNSVTEERSKEQGTTPVESSFPVQGHQEGMQRTMARQYYSYTPQEIGVRSAISLW